MPLARIVARQPSDAAALAEYLRTQGFEVETVEPGAAASAAADLEIDLERVPAEAALARAAQLAEERSADVWVAAGVTNALKAQALPAPGPQLAAEPGSVSSAGQEAGGQASSIAAAAQWFREAMHEAGEALSRARTDVAESLNACRRRVASFYGRGGEQALAFLSRMAEQQRERRAARETARRLREEERQAELQRRAEAEAKRAAELERMAQQGAVRQAELQRQRAEQEAARQAELQLLAQAEAARRAEEERRAREEVLRQTQLQRQRLEQEATRRTELERRAREESARRAEERRPAAEPSSPEEERSSGAGTSSVSKPAEAQAVPPPPTVRLPLPPAEREVYSGRETPAYAPTAGARAWAAQPRRQHADPREGPRSVYVPPGSLREMQWRKSAFVSSLIALVIMFAFGAAVQRQASTMLPSSRLEGGARVTQQVPFGAAASAPAAVIVQAKPPATHPVHARQNSPKRALSRRQSSGESETIAEDVIVRHYPRRTVAHTAETRSHVKRYSDVD